MVIRHLQPAALGGLLRTVLKDGMRKPLAGHRALHCGLLGALACLVVQSLPLQAQSGGPDAVAETYGDWIVRCANDPVQPVTAALACEMSQELRQSDNGQRLIAVTLRRDNASGIGTLTIVAPFGLLLPAGLRISVDGGDLLDIGFRTCLPAGCVGIAEVDDATVGAMALGAELTVTMTAAATGELIAIPLLIQGFDDAWARLGL